MALGISDATAYASPYTVGATITGNFSATGGGGGPYLWTIGAIDNALATISGTDSHTGASWNGPTLSLSAVSTTSQFIVEVYDTTSNTYAYLKTTAVTVNPAPTTVHTANYTASLTTDLFGLILVDATAGAVTVTLWSAYNVVYAEVTVVKVDASANAVTVAAPGTELLRAVAGGTVSLATRWAARRFKNNGLGTHYDLGT